MLRYKIIFFVLLGLSLLATDTRLDREPTGLKPNDYNWFVLNNWLINGRAVLLDSQPNQNDMLIYDTLLGWITSDTLSGGGLTGSGDSGQVTFWGNDNSLRGNSSLRWVDGHLLINEPIYNTSRLEVKSNNNLCARFYTTSGVHGGVDIMLHNHNNLGGMLRANSNYGDLEFYKWSPSATLTATIHNDSGFWCIGQERPTKRFSVREKFQVNDSGDICKLKNLSYSFPTAHDTGALVNNGSGTLTWGDAPGTVPVGGIILWSGAINTIPVNWWFCDGDSGTPDLRNKFIRSAYSSTVNPPGSTGGDTAHTHTCSTTGEHTHNLAMPGGIDFCVDNQVQMYEVEAAGDHYHTIGDNNHLPTYYSLAYIMRLR